MKIIGAGLAGLLCGALNPGSVIYEKQSQLPNNHGALLRFRSDKISRALGIPFKKVRVTKDIWIKGESAIKATPDLQNLYSNKVTGEYSSRSIQDIEPVDRWVAPDDFIQQLADRSKIIFNFAWSKAGHNNESTISTIPMPIMINQMFDDPEYKYADFTHREIWTAVYLFPDSVDLYQTIYFPGPETTLYRASFTGSKLICEFIHQPGPGDLADVWEAFGLRNDVYVGSPPMDKKQKYGKIVDIDPYVRRSIMSKLTHEHNIYSLGRYATWRNILLDDVFEDIFKIRDLMSLDDYSRRIKLAEEI